MDARSIAVQTYILQYLRKKGVRLTKSSKLGSLIHLEPAQTTGDKIEISVREFATHIADRMAPE